MISTPALAIAVIALTPLMVLIAWHDLKAMRIPNWSVLAVVGVFLATGIWGLPFEEFLWRLGIGIVVLIAGFLIFSIASNQIGAGDLKLIAALAPFLAGPDVARIMLIFALVAIAGLILHRLARAVRRGRETGWKAIDQSTYFPAGILLGATIMIHLSMALTERLV
ncbi:MAG: prepilin peptidase [Pseudomonadota bacterium]